MTPRIALFSAILLVAGCHANSKPPSEAQPASAKLTTTQPSQSTAVEGSATASTFEQSAVPSQPISLAAAFDQQLRRLINDEPIDNIQSLPADERTLVSSVIEALSNFRRAAKDESTLLSTKSAALAELSDHLRATQPLSIPALTLCRSVTQYGMYDPIDPARFPAAKETPVIIYCEVDNFRTTQASDAQWETKLSYEAVLYSEADAATSIITKKPTGITDRCRTRRRDFFLADRLTIPATLPVGRYLLKVTVIDDQANRVAERTLPVTIAVD